MANCWSVQLCSLHPLFPMFRDVIFQGWRLAVSSMSVGGNVETFLIFATFLCFSDLHRVATMASCWSVQLCSSHPLFPIFRDVIFQGWRLTVSSLSVGGNVETFFIFAIFFVSLICTGWQRWQVVGQHHGHPELLEGKLEIFPPAIFAQQRQEGQE